MSTIQQGKEKIDNKLGQLKKYQKTEKIFRAACITGLLILIFCVPGFLSFRSYCQAKNYSVFANSSLKWIVLGFFFALISKYSYFYFMTKPILKLLNPNYDIETKKKRLNNMLKVSYYTLYYSLATLPAYFLFRGQYWFPSLIGGNGSCSQIFRQYPDWPSNHRFALELYFCFQLGVHIAAMFELAVLERDHRKYYEWMLHHFMSSSLILFSMMCNQIAAGVMTLIVHDISDIFMSGCRFYLEAYVKKSWLVKTLTSFTLFFSWIYLRNIVFPFCMLSSVYSNIPGPADEWFMIHWEYLYLFYMAVALCALNLFWTHWLVKSFGKDILVV